MDWQPVTEDSGRMGEVLVTNGRYIAFGKRDPGGAKDLFKDSWPWTLSGVVFSPPLILPMKVGKSMDLPISQPTHWAPLPKLPKTPRKKQYGWKTDK